MKQLYYTSCETGKSVNGHSGFQVRAISPGVGVGLQQSAERLLGYSLPQGVKPDTSTVETAPVKLAFVETPETGRVLYHSVYAGQDPTTRRFGNFFSHILLELPEGISGAHAVRMWGSTFWRRKDDRGGTELPDVGELPKDGPLNSTSLREFLQGQRQREMFEFVFSALLTLDAERRVFLAASPAEIAICIYGVSRVLPKEAVKRLTFSTYESDPFASYARIVGTFWDPQVAPSTMDLPTACYDGAGVGFNSFSRAKSDLGDPPRYVKYATERALQGRLNQVDEFLVEYDKHQIDDLAILDLTYVVLQQPAELSQVDVQKALKHPGLSPLLCAQPDVPAKLLEWSLDDPQFRESDLASVVAALPEKQASDFGERVLQVGIGAIGDGNVKLATLALDEVFAIARPNKSAVVWNEVVDSVSDPGSLSDDMRLHLLPRILKHARPRLDKNPELMAEWLAVGDAELERLLVLLDDDFLRTRACVVHLEKHQSVSAKFLDVVGSRNGPKTAVPVIESLVNKGEDRLAKDVFFGLAERTRDLRGLTNEVMASDCFPAPFLDACLNRVMSKHNYDSMQLVSDHGGSIVTRIDGPTLTLVTSRVVDQVTPKLFAKEPVREFLKQASSDKSLETSVRNQTAALLTIYSFVDEPSLDSKELSRVAAALKVHPPTTRRVREDAKKAIVTGLLKSPIGLQELQGTFESVLTHFGTVLSSSNTQLFNELLSDCEKRSDLLRRHPFWTKFSLLHAFLAVSFGHVESVDPKLDAQESTAAGKRLAERMSKKCKKDTFMKIRKCAEQWSTKQDWQSAFDANKPKSLRKSKARGTRSARGKNKSFDIVNILNTILNVLIVAVVVAVVLVIFFWFL